MSLALGSPEAPRVAVREEAEQAGVGGEESAAPLSLREAAAGGVVGWVR